MAKLQKKVIDEFKTKLRGELLLPGDRGFCS